MFLIWRFLCYTNLFMSVATCFAGHGYLYKWIGKLFYTLSTIADKKMSFLRVRNVAGSNLGAATNFQIVLLLETDHLKVFQSSILCLDDTEWGLRHIRRLG